MNPGLGPIRAIRGNTAMMRTLRPGFGVYLFNDDTGHVHQWDGVEWQSVGGSGTPEADDVIKQLQAQAQARAAGIGVGTGSSPGTRRLSAYDAAGVLMPGALADPSVDDPIFFTAPPAPGPVGWGGMDVPTLAGGSGDSRSQSGYGNPAPPLQLFVAVGDSGKIGTSLDGVTWGQQTSPFGASNVLAVAYAPSQHTFVAVGAAGKVATSPNGVVWTLRSSGLPGAANLTSVAWSPSLHLFAAISSIGDPIITSPDGATWTPVVGNVFGNNGFNSIIWAEALGLFVVVGEPGNAKVVTSPDGIVWTMGFNFGINTDMFAVTWSPDVPRLVAGGGLGILYTSPDSINWAAQVSNMQLVTAVAWSPAASIFVAVGGTNRLATSPTGIVWTWQAFFANGRGVCWSPSAVLFVAVADGGNLSTSPDGLNWAVIPPVSSFGATRIRAVCASS